MNTLRVSAALLPPQKLGWTDAVWAVGGRRYGIFSGKNSWMGPERGHGPLGAVTFGQRISS
ncbi:MAG TPA: hypothetical protein VK148_18580, partial [Xanthobacteraceae bacterium]|nr:hypothetical protein [Xanthobacteraceae bacterium]